MSGNRSAKVTPHSVDLHFVAREIGPFLVPVSEMRTVAGVELDTNDAPAGMLIGLDVKGETTDGAKQFGLVLGPFVDPWALAAEIAACADIAAKQAAIDRGIDAIEAEKAIRELRRRHEREARRAVLDLAPQSVTCDFCARSVAVIVEGKRYCKRHAEEHGVRPRGKIGES